MPTNHLRGPLLVLLLSLVLWMGACDDDGSGSADGSAADAVPADVVTTDASAADAQTDAGPPAVTSVDLAGAPDGEIRQGGTGTLVVHGTGLTGVTSAKLGTIDLGLPAGPTSDTALELAVAVPHGHAPGLATLTLVHAAGELTVADVVTVTPIVVAADGTDAGRGTFASPLRLCATELALAAAFSDTVLLEDGTHVCDQTVSIAQGVTVRGESTAGTIVTGAGPGHNFLGFATVAGAMGTTRFETLTITNAEESAIAIASAETLEVVDVDMVDVFGVGIFIDGGGAATIERFRYTGGFGLAIWVHDGSADASDVTIATNQVGIDVQRGSLTLADSTVTSQQTALEVGTSDTNPTATHEATVTGSTLSGRFGGVSGSRASVTIEDSTLAAIGANDSIGVNQGGGELAMQGVGVSGFLTGVFIAPTGPLVPNAVLVGVNITGADIAVRFGPLAPSGNFAMRASELHARKAGVNIPNGFQILDLGTVASPGGNAITVDAGGFGLVDTRATAGAAIDAHGTQINGTTPTGTVTGPAEAAPAYKIAGPNTIHF